MINIGIIIAVGLVFFLSLGGLVWWIASKSKYRFIFWVWSKDLSSHVTIKAKLAVDPDNKSNRVFRFKNNPSILIMRDPQHWDKNKPVRWVVPDETGEYQYISPVNKLLKYSDVSEKGEPILKPIDDARYIKTRLHPVDKQLYCEQIRNNQKRYENKDPVQLATILGLIGLAAVLIIGMIYGIGIQVKNGNAVAENSKVLKDSSAAHDAASLKIVESMRETTNNLAYIYGQIYDSNVSVVRPVGGVKP